MVMSAMDWLMTLLSILRPNPLHSSSPPNTLAHVARITKMVVTFMPPAVEPGAPPISIRMTVTACPVPLIWVRSVVLKPAVLGVTA